MPGGAEVGQVWEGGEELPFSVEERRWRSGRDRHWASAEVPRHSQPLALRDNTLGPHTRERPATAQGRGLNLGLRLVSVILREGGQEGRGRSEGRQ